VIGELIAGGGIAIAGLVVGHFEGYLMGSKVRNVTSLFARAEIPSTAPCLCGHPVTAHREHGVGSCSAMTPGNAPGAGSGCACKFYVADPDARVGVRGELEI
jgi:hypothetical protein